MPYVRPSLGRVLERSPFSLAGRKFPRASSKRSPNHPSSYDVATQRHICFAREKGGPRAFSSLTAPSPDLEVKPVHPLRLGANILSPELAYKRYGVRLPKEPLERRPARALDPLSARLQWLRRIMLQMSRSDQTPPMAQSEILMWWRKTHSVEPGALEKLFSEQDTRNTANMKFDNKSYNAKLKSEGFSDLLKPQHAEDAPPDLSKRKELLRTFNALASQTLGQVASSTRSGLAQYGQFLAAEAHNSASLNYYSQVLASCSEPDQVSPSVLLSIRRWLNDDAFTGSTGERRKVELEAILLGPAGNDVNVETGAFRALCAPIPTSIRRPYFAILSTLDSKRIYEVWLEFQNTNRWRDLKSALKQEDERPIQHVAADSEHYISEYQELLHDIVEYLMIGDQPQLAWEAANTLEPGLPDLLPATWSLLLESPEYLSIWSESMQVQVLRKYEEYLETIENALGVEWTGGEEGTHKYKEEDGLSPEQVLKHHAAG